MAQAIKGRALGLGESLAALPALVTLVAAAVNDNVAFAHMAFGRTVRVRAECCLRVHARALSVLLLAKRNRKSLRRTLILSKSMLPRFNVELPPSVTTYVCGNAIVARQGLFVLGALEFSHRDTEAQRKGQDKGRQEGCLKGGLNHSTLTQHSPLPSLYYLCASVLLWLIPDNEETLAVCPKIWTPRARAC